MPREPASALAKGSQNSASGRSVSFARNAAAQSAVSEMLQTRRCSLVIESAGILVQTWIAEKVSLVPSVEVEKQEAPAGYNDALQICQHHGEFMSGYVKGGILGCCAVFVAIQFIQPARTNPPVMEANTIEAKVNMPPGVETILTSACKDCHSNETRWPWYAHVAPVSWFVINHVNDGRRRMNFSEWPPPERQAPARFAVRPRPTACERVETGDMPLFSYRLIHKDSRLTPEDKQAFCAWANEALPQGGRDF